MTEDNNLNERGSFLNALVRALRDGGDWLEIHDATGYTPFLYAAYLGKQEAMRLCYVQRSLAAEQPLSLPCKICSVKFGRVILL